MSDTTLNVVEIAYGPDGLPVVHIDAWQALQTPLMQTVQAEGLAVYTATGAVEYAVAEAVFADIRANVAAGEPTPVRKSHIDQLGLTAAVLARAVAG